MLLCNTLSYPHNIATFLFFELQVWVKYAKVELLDECIDVKFNLEQKKVIRKGLSKTLEKNSLHVQRIYLPKSCRLGQNQTHQTTQHTQHNTRQQLSLVRSHQPEPGRPNHRDTFYHNEDTTFGDHPWTIQCRMSWLWWLLHDGQPQT